MNSIYFPPELTLKKNKSSFQFNTKNENVPLSTLLNNIPLDNLKNYYDLETSFFIKSCDKLNFDFYNKIEQINYIPNTYNNLFIILFKEICLLIEEIERLNIQLREKTFKNRTNNFKEEKIEFDKNILNSPNKEKKVYPNKLNYIINVNTNNKFKGKSSQILKNYQIKENIEPNNFYSSKKINEINNNSNENFNNFNYVNKLNMELIDKGLNRCNKELENLKILEELILTNYQNNNINENNGNNKFNKNINNLNSTLKNLPF